MQDDTLELILRQLCGYILIDDYLNEKSRADSYNNLKKILDGTSNKKKYEEIIDEYHYKADLYWA